MKLYCIFGMREEETFELIDAWDEFNVEENEEGYFKRVAEIKKYAQYSSVREVIVNVSYQDVLDSFKASEIEGKLK